MSTSTLIDLNPIERSYYLLMISLDKYSGSCYAVDDLSTKISVPTKKHLNVKVFNNRWNYKTLVKHISCDCKCKFNSTTCNSNQKWDNKKKYS